ncbi:hypothetical protein C8Q75DRAFT_812054 [Abortiporus biennis]|nr:hypothetical protein C8Q75DRAFT_812054 [Abortiporus biennis]
MSVASSSRVSRRREPSSDAIEQDPSQMQVDEEDQQQPRQKGKGKVKQERVKQERSQAGPSQSQPEAEQEEEDFLKDFEEQPLSKLTAAKPLQGLSSDWGQVRIGVHKPAYGVLKDIAATIAEFAEGETEEKGLVHVENVMRQLLDTEAELRIHEEVLSAFQQKLMRGEEVIDVATVYTEEYKEKLADYKKKTTRQKYGGSNEYEKYREVIWEVKHPGDAMPPVTDFLPREDGDVSDDDEDVQVGGVVEDYKCPLTLKSLTDPLTSKICGHSFDATGIREWIGTKRSIPCPASGCNKELKLSDLAPNKELAKKAKEAARRERMREEDDFEEDDGEVVD